MKKYRSLFFRNTGLKQTVFKNTFWLYIGQIISRVFRLFLVIYAARALGASGYGAFSFAMSFIGLIFLISDLGTNALYIRESHKKEIDSKKLFANSLYLKLGLILLSIIVAILAVPLVHDAEVKGVLILIIVLYSISAMRDFLIALVRSMEKMQLETLSLAVDSIVTTLVGILILSKLPSLQTLSYSYILGSLLSLALMYGFLWRKMRIHSGPDLGLIKKIFFYSWPFVFGAAIGVFLGALDTVLIGWLKTSADVAYYSVGYRIIQASFVVPLFLGISLLPSLSRYFTDKEKLAALTSKALTFVGMIGLPILVGGLALSDKIILTLFGQEYSPSILVFRIQLFLIPLIFFTVILKHLALAVNLQKKDVQFTAIAAGVNLVLTIILIPRFSFNGAAAATLFAQFINFILIYRLSHNYLQIKMFKLVSFIKIILASAFMLAFILFLEMFGASIFYIVPSASLLYFFALYLMKDKQLLEITKLFKNG